MGSSAPPKRRFDFFADRATPRTLPSARVNSVTNKSASRSGYVRMTIASVSLSAIESQQVQSEKKFGLNDGRIVMDGIGMSERRAGCRGGVRSDKAVG